MKYRNLNKTDRIKIETMLNAGHKVVEIANMLGVHRSTIYRELKRGSYEHTLTDLTTETRYSSDLAQQKHDFMISKRGSDLKIGNNYKLVNFLEEMICDFGYSPESALALASKYFDNLICVKTLYRYIDAGLFLRLSNKYLPVKGKKKKKKVIHRTSKRASAGRSIDVRPAFIDERKTFGHWEMDTVKGKRGLTRSCLLVLTERLTRKEFIFKLPDQKSASVVSVLDKLERKYKSNFSNVFKSITVDNGVEFADCNGMERSVFSPDIKRTDLFYCHPYSSYERGSNENANKLIRRHIPKSSNIDPVSDSQVRYIENWINKLPRRILGFSCSDDLFYEYLLKSCCNILDN